MVNRSSSSGLSVAVMGKQSSKYNAQEGALLLDWVKQITGQNTVNVDGSRENFVAQLKDGTLLCNLANTLVPGSVKDVVVQAKTKSSSIFQQINNLELFIDFCHKQGVLKQELFRAVDLVEERDLYSVCMTLTSLGRIMVKRGKPGPRRVSAHEIVNLPLADQMRIQEIKTF
uniref:Calponin-homology (CH) domain-containing protein n=1 Tax=Globodera rostochiensis TaxID=31243 RepID=A0A914I5Q6_GLORO